MDFPASGLPPVPPGDDRWTLSAANNRRGPSKVLLIAGGALVAALILAGVLVLPALTGSSADETSPRPSPAAATPTAAPTSASPTPKPRPSASAAGGEYVAPYVPPAPKKTTPSEDEDDWDNPPWDDNGDNDWDNDDPPWWEDN
ncbi:hypothetical protein [Cryptosporangium sp. NPDC051539]|uniref:hypothetical protein n=1 Tax=Cryptosporangium sp. NPDC051539 TaxID=3363962 RepID=UPI0037A529EA